MTLIMPEFNALTVYFCPNFMVLNTFWWGGGVGM